MAKLYKKREKNNYNDGFSSGRGQKKSTYTGQKFTEGKAVNCKSETFSKQFRGVIEKTYLHSALVRITSVEPVDNDMYTTLKGVVIVSLKNMEIAE